MHCSYCYSPPRPGAGMSEEIGRKALRLGSRLSGESCGIGDVDAGIDEAARERIYQRSSREKAFCRDCAIRERCNNTCGCLNWQTTGTLDQVSPVLCRYEQMLVPLADEIGRKLYKKRDPLFLHKHYNAAYPVLSVLEDSMDRK
jgi:uncharacterized protein